jgi:hypothetical protein
MAAVGQQRGARAIFSCMGHRSCASAAHSPPAAAHSPGRCLEQLGRVPVIQPCPAGHGVEVTGRQPHPGGLGQFWSGSNAQAPFAASPQEHSPKPTCGALAAAQGTGRASDQAARCPSAGRPSIPAGVTSALAGPTPQGSRYPAAHRCSWRWEKMSIWRPGPVMRKSLAWPPGARARPGARGRTARRGARCSSARRGRWRHGSSPGTGR